MAHKESRIYSPSTRGVLNNNTERDVAAELGVKGARHQGPQLGGPDALRGAGVSGRS